MTKCASTHSYREDCHGQQCTHEAEVKCMGCGREFCDECVSKPMYDKQGNFDLEKLLNSEEWYCRDCKERKRK